MVRRWNSMRPTDMKGVLISSLVVEASEYDALAATLFAAQQALLTEGMRADALAAENAILNMEMVAYREKLTPADVAAMGAVIKALQAEKDARTVSEPAPRAVQP